MYITLTHGPHQPTTVYGPIEDRHPPAAVGPGQTAIITPLHSAAAITDITSVLPRVARVSRRTAAVIAGTNPAPDDAGPVALLLVNPNTRLLIAIGPFATAKLSHTWRRQRTDLPAAGITCIPLLLSTPPSDPFAAGGPKSRHEEPR
jgi:hypothetical protein